MKIRKLSFIAMICFCCVNLLSAQTEKPVTFTRDQLQLVGVLHLPATSDAKVPAVLLLHGFTGHKAETHFMYTQLARRLAKSGIAVLRFDFAGSGDSQGEFVDMSILTELADARSALQFLRQNENIDAKRIGLLGFSMGGCVAALLAGENLDLKALVLWAPVAKPMENFSHLLDMNNKKYYQGKLVSDISGLALGQAFIDALPQLFPLQAIEKFSAPALVIQGTKDQAVPPSAGQDYVQILQRNNPVSRLAAIENSDHTFSSLAMVDQVLTLTTEWFQKHLSVK